MIPKSCKLNNKLHVSKRQFLLLDGGMGTSLNKLGLSELEAWGSPRLLDNVKVRSCVKQTHIDFLNSGVDILTTNTYDSNIQVECGRGHYVPYVDTLDVSIRIDQQWEIQNIDLAKEAVDEYMLLEANKTKDRPILAFSVGSFATTIGGRAESANREQREGDDDRRREGYGASPEDIRKYLDDRLSDSVLSHAKNSGVAVIAFETVGDLLEVKIICDALEENIGSKYNELSAWVTLTCLNADIVDTGASVESCFEVLANCPYISGLGVNCTEPQYVAAIIEKLKKVLKFNKTDDKIIVVYPNSGETYLSWQLKEGEVENWKRADGCGEWSFAESALGWIESGVQVVGGCCRITAEDIAELHLKTSNAAGA